MDNDSSNCPVEIGCEHVKRLIDAQDDFLLLDCREHEEHVIAHIVGSTLIPMEEIPARLGELERYQAERIIVYCHGGVRSFQVANWLRSQGFPEAQSMSGGIDAWAVEIDPQMPRY